MKAILVFDISDPEDSREHKIAINAGKAFRVISDFENYMRNLSKYNSEQLKPIELKLLEKIRKQFGEIVIENGLQDYEEFY